MRLVSTLSRRIRRPNHLSTRIQDALFPPLPYRQAETSWLPNRNTSTLSSVRCSATAAAPEFCSRDTRGQPDLYSSESPLRIRHLDRVQDLKDEDVELAFNHGELETAETPTSALSLGDYGKWQWLSLRPDLLEFESDIASRDPRSTRLVDLPENENDIYLWSCLLDFRYRRHGTKGVSEVLDGLRRRLTLREVEGEVALAFWQIILREALRCEELLGRVWSYAEFLFARHQVRFPKLYTTTISYFLGHRQFDQALRWHILLAPSFGPDATEFVGLLKRFLAIPNHDIHYTLKALYSTSHHRCLYDDIVPFVYARCHHSDACRWRNHFLLHDDLPRSAVARPFLRFLAAYLPGATKLVPRELEIAGLQHKNSEGGVEYEPRKEDFWYLLNRVHGQTFGIEEKAYNDQVGARWFASSWMPLEMAIDLVRILGFNSIGPLSLQSIALRDGSADRVFERIEQLAALGIGLGDSNYVLAIKHLAAIGDQERLMDLLDSDIHPDVFDDWETQEHILKAALAEQDWKKHRLILTVKAVCLASESRHPQKTPTLVSNYLLGRSFVRDDKPAMVKILQDMETNGLQISPALSDAISAYILENISPYSGLGLADVTIYSSICRHVVGMRFPLATEALHVIMVRLCREGRLEDVERLSLAVARRYNAHMLQGAALCFTHERDVSDLLKGEQSEHSHFQATPTSLAPNHPLHPLRLIFNLKLQGNIVGASIRFTLLQRQNGGKYVPDTTQPGQPEDYGFARGIHLLAMLKKSGVAVSPTLISKATIVRFAELYGTAVRSSRRVRLLRGKNQLSLKQAKELCDEAWGSELLPSLPELTYLVEKKALEKERKLAREMERRGATDATGYMLNKIPKP